MSISEGILQESQASETVLRGKLVQPGSWWAG